MAFRIPLCRIETGAAERDYIDEALSSGAISHGAFNDALSQQLAQVLDQEHVCLTSSCYAALHAVLHCLGINGEVIVPSFTFAASVNAIYLAGATPVFADIDVETQTVNAETLRAVLTKKTQAIMLVHFAGQMCDMEPIMSLAQAHGLVVIEDAAQALGASHKGRPSGSFGIGCYSFFATKVMTTGEGGCVATNDAGLMEDIQRFIGHGIRRDMVVPWRRECISPGMNFRMSNVAAAIGVAQMERLENFVNARRRIAKRYDQRLQQINGVTRPTLIPGNRHCYQMYTIQVVASMRDNLVKALRAEGIEASVHFDPPVHRQSWYQNNLKPANLPGTDYVASQIISLPIFPSMTADEVDEVANAVARFFNNATHPNQPESEI